MMLAVCVGTWAPSWALSWAGLGLMTGAAGRYSTPLLGAALVLYAATGFAAAPVGLLRKDWGRFAGPVTGFVTGAITAATGVFVIPAVPYLQALGLGKEELVQALGLSFTVSTIALAVNVTADGAMGTAATGTMIAALALACTGMWFGQTVRLRMAPAVFRHWFFLGLMVLGLYLMGRSVLLAASNGL
jgi:uncharacterized membrane protein YfcA